MGAVGNTTTAGTAGDTDQFSIWLLPYQYPTQIQSITIMLQNPAADGAMQGALGDRGATLGLGLGPGQDSQSDAE